MLNWEAEIGEKAVSPSYDASAKNKIVDLLLSCIGDEKFTLFDVGCSGGIDPGWLVLQKHLRAFAFDINLADVERLRAANTAPGVEYIGGHVGAPNGTHSQPLATPWWRLSVARSQQLHAKTKPVSGAESTTGEAAKSILLTDFARDRGITDIDFIKIDIDGGDFDLLQSIETLLSESNVLGLRLEVNFYGSDNPGDHTFHNTDRFMRKNGYELVDLSFNRYSLAALPSRYVWDFPGQSVTGRPFQGDAIYVRDLCADRWKDLAQAYSNVKLLKLVILFVILKLDDHAAELLNVFGNRIGHADKIEQVLDLLTAHTSGSANPLRYQEYIAKFEKDAPMFYRPPELSPPEAFARRVERKLVNTVKRILAIVAPGYEPRRKRRGNNEL